MLLCQLGARFTISISSPIIFKSIISVFIKLARPLVVIHFMTLIRVFLSFLLRLILLFERSEQKFNFLDI